MNEKHMQYVLTVLKEGSFTGAAKKLYVSQPSVSQIIKAAEANLGAPIFNRNTDPITLTPAGALYVKAAKQISTISTNLAKQVEELSNEEFGKIRLGISVQRGMELLPYLYPRFKSRFPHVELELHEQGSATMEESVLEETDTLKITHEKIASHMGTAREVVTRMLKYFQTEGLVRLSRGAVEILDRKGLSVLADT